MLRRRFAESFPALRAPLKVGGHLLVNRWLLAADGQQPIAMLPGERSALRKGALRQ
jgi:hypothetical protein